MYKSIPSYANDDVVVRIVEALRKSLGVTCMCGGCHDGETGVAGFLGRTYPGAGGSDKGYDIFGVDC